MGAFFTYNIRVNQIRCLLKTSPFKILKTLKVIEIFDFYPILSSNVPVPLAADNMLRHLFIERTHSVKVSSFLDLDSNFTIVWLCLIDISVTIQDNSILIKHARTIFSKK